MSEYEDDDPFTYNGEECLKMARRGNKGGGNDKYLRLTGLWPSKSNDALFTGRVKPDGIEDLLKRCEEALDQDSPLVFSLWENDKKESRKDPEFSLQCFVGDSEEKPRSSRSSRSSRDEEPRGRSKRDRDEEPEDKEEEAEEEPAEEPEEKEERSSRKSSRTKPAKTGKKSSRSDSW